MKSFESEIKKIIKNNFKASYEDIEITYIDQSVLDRNHVYRFTIDNKSYVIKISLDMEKWMNEIKVLNILKDFEFAPNVIFKNKGNSMSYIIMNNIEGISAIKHFQNLNKKDKERFIYNLGLMLAEIHNTRKYESYGSWEKTGKNNLINLRSEKDNNIIKKIEKNYLDRDPIIRKGMRILEKERKKLLNLEPKLTHKDFSLRNTLINDKGKIMGILDYEHSIPEDPSLDICSLFHSNLLDSSNNFNIFKEGYEKIGEFPYNFIHNKKYYLVNTGLYLCGRFSTKNTDIYNRGLTLINKAIEL